MTFVTTFKKIKKRHLKIRRPQWECCTFAVALRMQRRLRAAAQHSSSELGSAFTLHRNCTCIEEELQI